MRAIRQIQGVVGLTRTHPRERVLHAVTTALTHQCFRYKDVARLASLVPPVAARPLRTDDPSIRPMTQYRLEDFLPKLPKAKLVNLVGAQFLRDHGGVLLIGPPGIGKSHIATAIAVGAIHAGHRAFVRSTFDLAQDFAEATGERRAFVQHLTRVDLLVLEDFGMKKLGASAAEDLLEVFVRRHETASTLITTNRPTQDWALFLGDVPAATAILDRFLAHAEIIPLQGKSYRLRQRTGTTTES